MTQQHTYETAVLWGADVLENVSERPRPEARILLAHTLQVSQETIFTHPTTPLPAVAFEEFSALIHRRRAHEPIAKIIGYKAFWKSTFRVTAATLDPRPDSETLIEGACAYFKNRPPHKILDLGTGSGCLLISLLMEFPEAHGVGVDLSADALAIAAENVAAHDLQNRTTLIHSDWAVWRQTSGMTSPFDLIIANPPYVAEDDQAQLSEEVKKFDPFSALFAGKDGLSCYPGILTEIRESLSPMGFAFVEIGAGQAPAILKLCDGLTVHAHLKDLGRHVRCLVLSQGE